MASKYYAVKEGRNIGVFGTWDECKAQVDGYSGAVYKSFKTLDEAKAFIGITVQSGLDKNDGEKQGLKKVEKSENTDVERGEACAGLSVGEAVAYVDGSFNVTTNEFSYGAVIFYDDKEVHLKEKFDSEELAAMRNVAGEIYGSMAAMQYAMDKGLKKVKIYHDYEGIAKWCQGLWKTNKAGTMAYKAFYDEAKEKIDIEFVKVKGHSGDKYNDLADKLAKEALGIE